MKKTLVLKAQVETVEDIGDGDIGWVSIFRLFGDVNGNYWLIRETPISRKAIRGHVKVENRSNKIIANVSNCMMCNCQYIDRAPTHMLFVDVLIRDKGVEYKGEEA